MKKTSLRALPENELARFQTLQKGNNCTLHAISAALDLLCGFQIAPDELIAEVNRLWFRGRFYRLFPNWAVTPPMQARIVRYLAKTRNLPLKARLLHISPEVLRNLPHDENLTALVTIYWLAGKAPPIYHGTRGLNYNQVQGMGGHTMLFAAFDPDHLTDQTLLTPWGFINSWSSGGTGLFWMQDADFRKAWGFPLLNLGSNAAVIISKTHTETLPHETLQSAA